MRRLLYLFGFLFSATLLTAGQVDQYWAKQVAVAFASQYQRNISQPQLAYTHPMPNQRADALYVVNLDNSGFVIVAANDVAHPVLGYSFERPWPYGDELPSQVASYLDGIAAQIEFAIDKAPDQRMSMEWIQLMAKQSKPVGKGNREEVGPLLTTTWDQTDYYNGLCPVVGNGHAPAGCAATALAQIVNYHQYPEHGRNLHSYEVEGFGELMVDFNNETFDYANMPDALTYQSAPGQIQAVDQLIYDCGVALNMQYDPTGSSSALVDVRGALVNFFDYSPDMYCIDKQAFTYEEWDALLRSELNAGRPICYSGVSANNYYCHAFVCDGFNTEGFFHFNFGWSGNCDGWYLTSSINLEVYQFNLYQAAVIGIAPGGSDNTIIGQIWGNTVVSVDEPIDFYHVLGHNNEYREGNFFYGCVGQYTFLPTDGSRQLMMDVEEYSKEVYNMDIYDGTTTDSLIRRYNAYDVSQDYSPVFSTQNALNISYGGKSEYEGFHLFIMEDDGCLRVSNVVFDVDTTSVTLSWTENGSAVQWEIEYGLAGFEHGSGLAIVADSCQNVEVSGLEPLRAYDFYVRSICSNGCYGPWSAKVNFMTGNALWIDKVTSRPDGYVVDENGDVYISSAEGLAWFACVVEGYHSLDKDVMEGKTVYLTEDIDLQSHEWRPIHGFRGSFNGQGHVISHMCVLEKLYLDQYGLYNNDFDGGLFSSMEMVVACINDVHLRDVYVYVPNWGSIGALVGSTGRWNYEGDQLIRIMNCSVTGTIVGKANVGGLVGCADDDTEIFNCMSNCTVKANQIAAGICGRAIRNCSVRNCYSSSCVIQNATTNKCGVIDNAEYSSVQNCYAIYDSPFSAVAGGGIGTTLEDWSRFALNDTVWTLIDRPIVFDSDTTDELLRALNLGVEKINEDGMRSWVKGAVADRGLPVFGPEYEVVCPNVANLRAHNVLGADENVGVMLSWTEIGEATSWEVKYRSEGSTTVHYVMASGNPDTVFGLTLQTKYLFSVRPVCDDLHHGGWCKEVGLMVGYPYWTEVVDSQPEGYVVDETGNIAISSAEGLAWFANVVNGMEGQPGNSLAGHSVTLTQDVDMGWYKWMPVNNFLGLFDGGNHIINGLNVNELGERIGMFGELNGGLFQNVRLENVYVKGISCVGGLIGYAHNVTLANCHVSGTVFADLEAGGLVAEAVVCVLDGCSASGKVDVKHTTAGGLIGILNGSTLHNSYSRCEVALDYLGGGLLAGTCYNSHVANCYAVGSAHGHTSSYNYPSLIGVLYSTPEQPGELRNCYAQATDCGHGNMIFDGFRRGSLVGNTSGNAAMSHCYGSADFVVGPLVGEPQDLEYGYPDISDTTRFTLLYGVANLLDAVSVGNQHYTDMLDVLNAWVDAYDTLGQYRHWLVDENMVNEGFPVLEETENLLSSQDYSFVEGWNWWSTSLESAQEGLSLGKQFLDALQDHGVVVYGPESVSIYDGNSWMGSFYYVENENSYKVKMSSPYEFSLFGFETSPSDHPITLNSGWNWLGYPLATPMTVDHALENLTPSDRDVVKSQQRFAVYHPRYNWVGTLEVLEPGVGYMYNSHNSSSVTFTYPDVLQNCQVASEDNHYHPNMAAYMDNMTLVAVVRYNDRELDGDRYELAAFVNDECCGSVKLKRVGDRWYAFMTIAGNSASPIQMKLYDSQTGSETVNYVGHLDFLINSAYGAIDSPVEINFYGTGVDEGFAEKVFVSPNPVATGGGFNVGLMTEEGGMVRVDCFNVLGEFVCSESSSNRSFKAPQTPGVYTLKITADQGTCYYKLVVR